MSIVKLQVRNQYASYNRFYQAGDVIEVTDAEAAFLQNDAPGCFEVYKPGTKAFDGPPADKMIGSAPAQKDLGALTVSKLKEELEKLGLPTGGKKDDLVKRLEEIEAADIEEPKESGEPAEETPEN